MKSVAILPLRKGSKSIPDKNIMEICGKPLFRWVLDELLKSSVDGVIISTDYDPSRDLSIEDVSAETWLGVIPRPTDLCQDDTPLEPVIEHALQYTDADLILIANSTCPLTRAEDFDAGLQKMSKRHITSVVSVVQWNPFRFERPNWGSRRDRLYIGPCKRFPFGYGWRWPNRDEYGLDIQQQVGCFWMIKRRMFKESGTRLGKTPRPYFMPPWAIHELDEPDDIPLIEGLLEMRKAGKI